MGYLKYSKNNDRQNKKNIKQAIDCFENFSKWSGLNINKNKTYVNIFGVSVPEPPFIKELNLKYCKSFTLLGITYDSTLQNMMTNYDEGIKKLETVTNDWRHKYLTICGKITVVKTFMLSVLSHVATVLPTPNNKECKKIEKIITDFIRGEKEQDDPNEDPKLKPSIISQDVLFSPKSNNGLGLQRVATFWSSIKLSWLRRLRKESFWKQLHLEDLKDKRLLFNPYNSNETDIKKAIHNLENPTMKQIYSSLLECKAKLIEMQPEQILFLPIYGEHRVRKNNTPALCEWAKGTRVIDRLTTNGDLIPPKSHVPNALKQPSQNQSESLKNSLKTCFKEIYNNAVRQQTRDICSFNTYGRIIFKSKTGCAYYYSLLNHKKNKTLLWESSRLSIERDWQKHNIHITLNISVER